MPKNQTHKYTFAVKNPNVESGESDYEWVEYSPRKFKLVKKEKENE